MKLITTYTICLLLIFSSCQNDKPERSSTIADETAITKNTETIAVDSVAAVIEDSLTTKPEKVLTESVAIVKKPTSAKKVEVEKPKKPKKRAKMTFENKVHEFGYITQGEEITHTFKFKNTGTADLVIKSHKKSCGCAAPSYSFLPIEPGATGEVKVLYRSAGKLASQEAKITLTTNASPAIHVLKLKGVVKPPN